MESNVAYVPTDIVSIDYNYVSYSTPNNAIHTKVNEAYAKHTQMETQAAASHISSGKIPEVGLKASNGNFSDNPANHLVPLTDNPAYSGDRGTSPTSCKIKSARAIETSSDYSYVIIFRD